MRMTILKPLAAVAMLLALLVPTAHAQRGGDNALTAADVSHLPEQPYDYFRKGLRFDPAVPTPASVLGHRIGERFSRHVQRVAYCQALAEGSGRVRFERYGTSVQGRPLVVLTISSPSNLARLDEILAANGELADPASLDDDRAEAIVRDNPAIVWYSFGVHGNEASCGEASMQLAYTLAAARNREVREILDKTVIVIDPQLNPDGQMRYVSWYQNARGSEPDPTPLADEHNEPWPGGRTNHYLFDLNRDWVWGVQPESRQRLAIYRRYLPQLHLDYHEQGYTSPYFFGEGDTPYNANIPRTTRNWIAMYGEQNADAFDRLGLVYATRERFDYLYPGYGKVLPIYHGAVGMLLEQAGHSRAGLAIEVSDQYTLTLSERVRHHLVTALSYAETTAATRGDQLRRFRDFWQDNLEAATPGPAAFAFDPRNDRALLGKLWDFCAMHGIEVGVLERQVTTDAFAGYDDGRPVEKLTLPEGAWIIDACQPMGALVRAMFERETFVEDPDTYDITGWSLPIAFGLDAWHTDQRVDLPTRPLEHWTPTPGEVVGSGDVALVIDARQHHFPAAVGAAVEHELFCRVLGGEVVIGSHRFAAGSLVVHRVRNQRRDLDAFVEDALALGLDVHRVDTGLAGDAGPSLGNNANPILRNPRVLLVTGSGTSSYSAGQHWHLLDIAQPFPHTRVTRDRLASIDLSDYTVIVMPSMGGLSGRAADRVRDWVRGGGTVIATGGAARWALSSLADASDDSSSDDERSPANELTWAEREQRAVHDRVSGALAIARLDDTHPMAAGVRPWLGMLVRGYTELPLNDNAYAVARYDREAPIVSGPVSEENLDKMRGTPLVIHQRVGSGAVIAFAEDVTIRGFQHGAMRLLMNAIVYGPTLSRF